MASEAFVEGKAILADLFADMKWRTEHNDVYGDMVRLSNGLLRETVTEDEAVDMMGEIFDALMNEGRHSRSVHFQHGAKIEAFQAKAKPSPRLA